MNYDEIIKENLSLKELNEKRTQGVLRKGRPSNPTSARQQKIAAKTATIQLNLEE